MTVKELIEELKKYPDWYSVAPIANNRTHLDSSGTVVIIDEWPAQRFA